MGQEPSLPSPGLSHLLHYNWVRRMDCFPKLRNHVPLHPKAVSSTGGRDSTLELPALGLRGGPLALSTPLEPGPHPAVRPVVSPSKLIPCFPGPWGKLPQAAEGVLCPSWVLTWDPS